jgi:hypothetical protein
MHRGFSWRTIALALIVWTAGAVAIWVVAEMVLNPGVAEDDIQECLAEGFIPPEECEETLERLETDDDSAIAIGASLLIWAVGSLALLLVLTRPRPTDST